MLDLPHPMVNTKSLHRNVELLYEIGTLRHITRGWKQHIGTNCANTMEHTLRVMWIALILARMEGTKCDEAKIMQMALTHDLADIRTVDLSYVQKMYMQDNDDPAITDTLKGTALADLFGVFKEYKSRKSRESQIVKDADNLDVDLEMRELEEQGHQLPRKWHPQRKSIVFKKLYTKSARKLWKQIYTTDVSSWHLVNNKWFKIPSAGK